MEEFPDFDSFFSPTANYGSATAGIPALGGIGLFGDEDWFQVTLVAGHQYEIQVRGAPTSDGTLLDPLFIGIYDDLGMFIPGSGDDDSGIGLNSQTEYG